MLPWLQSIDAALFRFINLKLGTPALDPVMKALSGTAWFIPAVLVLAAGLLWKGGKRGRVFVVVLALTLGLGDSFVINPLKKLTGRDRNNALAKLASRANDFTQTRLSQNLKR